MQGLSADEIVSRFPHLTMAGVYTALSYSWDHRDEIHKEMQEEAALVEDMKQKYPSPLKEKLAGKDAANHSVR